MRATQSEILVKIHRADGSSLDVSDLLVQYTDTHPVSGIPTFSLALPLRYGQAPFVETIRTGDLVEVAFLAYPDPGQQARYYTAMVGVIKELGQQQAITQNGLKQLTIASGQHLAGWLGNETINYYLAAVLTGKLDLVLGAQATYKQFMSGVIQASGLDEAAHLFLGRVAFEVIGLERPQGNIAQLLGYRLKSLEGRGAFYATWGNYQGTAWGILDAYSDKPLHELYATTLPLEEFQKLDGYKNTPFTWGEDRAVPLLMLRPAPFPYALPGGKGTLGEWTNLPLHDLTQESLQLESGEDHTADYSDKEVYSAFFVNAAALAVSETFAKTYSPPVVSVPKYRRYGYRPLTWQTVLWQNSDKEVAPEFFRRLNWRVAGQWNRMDEYAGANFGLRLAPWIRPGQRVRYRNQLGDHQSTMEGYVESVSHSFVPGGAKRTTLKIIRALPVSTYRNPAFFAWGLSELRPIKDAYLPVANIQAEESKDRSRIKKP